MVDPSKDADLREAIELLYWGYKSFTLGPDRILAKRGLNRAHHRILYFVGRDPGLSINDLLEILDISKQALHTPLRQLVQMNLITNKKAAHDGRVRQLWLTAAGKRLELKLTGVQQEQLQTVFDSLGPEARESWKQVMRAMAR